MPDITLLGDWLLRDYQLPLWDYLRGGGLRAVPVWNRRAGKDEVCLAHCSLSMLERPATYWYMLPMANQARTAIWEAVNPKTGKRRVDEFFPDPLFQKRETDMMIHCKANASTWQLKGSDNYGAGIGSPPAGVVFSEFSQADAMAWAYISPILIENNGWAVFPSTPRGHNHLEQMLDISKTDKSWFGEVLTVDQTKVITNEQLQNDLRDKQRLFGEAEGKALWLQEWYCNFDAGVPGSYYGDLMMEADAEGRITDVPYDPRFPVTAIFDLGAADATAIGFWQTIGLQNRCFDYEERSGITDLAEYAEILRKKNYRYAQQALILPHDAGHERLGQSMSVAKQFQRFGYHVKILPKTDIDPGIRAGRNLLRMAYIDRTRCKRLIECLRNYHRVYDEGRKAYSEKPLHDWSSHGADCWRYAGVGYTPAVNPMATQQTGQWRRQALQSRPIRDPWALPSR
jgi:hypothetical protein